MGLCARSSATPSTPIRWTSCGLCRAWARPLDNAWSRLKDRSPAPSSDRAGVHSIHAAAGRWPDDVRSRCPPSPSWTITIQFAVSYMSRRIQMPEERRVLLEVKNLKKYFPLKSGFMSRGTGTVKAVDGINLHILQGETLGLVGESGSGKTTAGRTILRAMNPTDGEIIFHLQEGPAMDLAKLDPAKLRAFRRHAQMIFQDPYSSLNPRMTVRDIIAEPLVATGLAQGTEVDERVREIAHRCQLSLEHL